MNEAKPAERRRMRVRDFGGHLAHHSHVAAAVGPVCFWILAFRDSRKHDADPGFYCLVRQGEGQTLLDAEVLTQYGYHPDGFDQAVRDLSRCVGRL